MLYAHNFAADWVADAVASLYRDGYLILDGLLNDLEVGSLRGELAPHFEAAAYGTGAFYGETTRRFGSVLSRSSEARKLALNGQVMSIINEVIGRHCECIQLNLTQAIEIWPGAPVQVPHRDHDMWRAPKGGMEFMVNVMWALDDFTAENGATRIWPGSNRGDLDGLLPDSDAISAVMPKGSACIFLGSTLHSGGANRSSQTRRGLIISYCQGWLKPWENQWLAYPPQVARNFPPELSALVGYQQHLPSLGNYEGQCPSVLLNDNVSWNPFTDALREDQVALMTAYYAQAS